jgi:hypothetical protein
VKKYKKFSEVFYLVILSLTIPFYLVLYAASGHEFRPEPEDVMWMRVIVVAIISMTVYLIGRRFQGIGTTIIKIIFGVTLICTIYGGLNVLWYILNFKFGSDIGIPIVILWYTIPVVFLYSSFNLGYWLIKGQWTE